MRKGLLVQWHRGIAVRGIAAAMLLMVPVLVAATIGFGGVGGGLTSFASGPSESSVNPTINARDRSQSIEALSTTLPRALTTARQSSSQGPRGDSGRPVAPLAGSQGSGGTAIASPGANVPATGGGGNDAAAGGGVAGGGAGQVPSPPPPTSAPVLTSPEIVNQLLQGLLGKGSP